MLIRVGKVTYRCEGIVINQGRFNGMNQGTECHTIKPTSLEVLNVHMLVSGSGILAPLQQLLFGQFISWQNNNREEGGKYCKDKVELVTS